MVMYRFGKRAQEVKSKERQVPSCWEQLKVLVVLEECSPGSGTPGTVLYGRVRIIGHLRLKARSAKSIVHNSVAWMTWQLQVIGRAQYLCYQPFRFEVRYSPIQRRIAD